MSKRAVYLATSMFALVAVFCLLGLDLAAQEPTTDTQANANMSNTNTVSKPRSKKRAKSRSAKVTGAADQSATEMQNTNMAGETQAGQSMDANTNTSATSRSTRRARHTRTQMTTEQPDLSGTYAGVFDCSDAGLVGDTTLTITGNQFTTADGKSGHITAATTGGYTAVALQVGEFTMPEPGQAAGAPPMIMSMRARIMGARLFLHSVPGANHSCTFTPSSSNTARRRGMRRRAAPAVTAEPAGATQPAEMAPAATETPRPSTPRRRRGRRNVTNTNNNMNSNSSSPMSNENTGAENSNVEAGPTPPPK